MNSFRYGAISKLTDVIENGVKSKKLLIEFSSRIEAESALRKGANYAGKILSMDWYEGAPEDISYTSNNNTEKASSSQDNTSIYDDKNNATSS
jgi:hypothetical protein